MTLPAESPSLDLDQSPIEAKRFDQLPLSESVQRSIERTGYQTPTSVQAAIIPAMAAGSDVLAQSQTGTGKTAAFALPILSRIEPKSKRPQVLVLTPTRELAVQVAASFDTYASGISDFSVTAIYGGQDYEVQLRQLRRGTQVIVGTPGRVIDLIRRGTLQLGEIRCVVLDEADEMLNMGFLEDVEFILAQTPPERQVALFSATLPGPIRSIAKRYLNDPVRVTIERKTATAESIRQRALVVSPREKIDVLRRVLEVEPTDGVIVFTKTKDASVSVAEQLARSGFSAVALNGDMPQKVRERTIDQLKSGRLNILVATDVAARGLDVSRISHVFNYDLPHDSESYIHRVGRTGRAGRTGEAIIFLTRAQRGKLRLIERATRQSIEVVQAPTADEVNRVRVQRFHSRLTEVIGTRDLSFFEQMIGEYAESSGHSLGVIAAALAEVGQSGRPFLLEKKPRVDSRDRGRTTESGSRAAVSDRAGPRDKRSNDRRPDGDAGRQLRPAATGMVRYRVEVGKRDGVRPGNLVGAIANEAGIDGDFIGPIRIHDRFSTVDLPDELPVDIYQTLQRVWVRGKQLRLKPDTGGASRPDKPHRKEKQRGAFPKRKSGKTVNRQRPSGHGKSGKPGKKKARLAR